MAADSYIARVAGKWKQIVALVVSTGSPDANKLVALDATGKLSTTVMPVGVVPDTYSLVTSESLSAGDIANIYDNGGVITARKGDATTNGKPGKGFVLAGVTSPAAALVYTDRGTVIPGLTGLTKGLRYYLSAATPGGLTSTPVTGTGKLDQYIGLALSATELLFEPEDGVELA